MRKYLAYTWMEAKRQWRNREVLIFRLGLPTVVYLILASTGIGESNGLNTAPGLSALPSNTTRMIALAAFAALISGLAAGPSLGEERASGWLRQLRATPLRPSVAVAAKTAVSMSFALPAIGLIAGTAGAMEEVSLGWEQWARLVGSMWVATIPLTALGTLIGLAFKAEAAQSATTLAFVVLWLLGGIFTPPSELPDALATISEGLPSYGMIQVGWAATTGDTVPASALAVLTTWTAAATALAALAWRRIGRKT